MYCAARSRFPPHSIVSVWLQTSLPSGEHVHEGVPEPPSEQLVKADGDFSSLSAAREKHRSLNFRQTRLSTSRLCSTPHIRGQLSTLHSLATQNHPILQGHTSPDTTVRIFVCSEATSQTFSPNLQCTTTPTPLRIHGATTRSEHLLRSHSPLKSIPASSAMHRCADGGRCGTDCGACPHSGSMCSHGTPGGARHRTRFGAQVEASAGGPAPTRNTSTP